MTEVLVIPTWCDPKRRTVRLSWDDIWVGLFCVDDDTIAYGNAQGIVIEVPRSGATVKWMRGGWALGSRFELQTPDGLYRFYLNRPHPSAPTPEPSLLNNVAGFLSGGGQLLSLVDGTLGTFGSVAGPVGDLASRSLSCPARGPASGMPRRCGLRAGRFLAAFLLINSVLYTAIAAASSTLFAVLAPRTF
jgi:hypothetical protein